MIFGSVDDIKIHINEACILFTKFACDLVDPGTPGKNRNTAVIFYDKGREMKRRPFDCHNAFG